MMSEVYIYSFGSVAVVSAISLTGILLLSFKEDVFRKYLSLFISVAVGALLGDSFIHLIPEAFAGVENTNVVGLLIIAGVLSFFVLEKFLHWHHHGEDAEKSHIHPVGKLILVSDGVHNFLDGVIIAASFTVSPPVGFATTLAVGLHEIPQEVGDFAVLLHAGYTKQRALWLNFLSALSAILGAMVFFAIGEFAAPLTAYFIPLTAGGFIYIAVADLIPELQKTKQVRDSAYQLIAVLSGIAMMMGLTFLE
jgi:zinc and cadmium transporter